MAILNNTFTGILDPYFDVNNNMQMQRMSDACGMLGMTTITNQSHFTGVAGNPPVKQEKQENTLLLLLED